MGFPCLPSLSSKKTRIMEPCQDLCWGPFRFFLSECLSHPGPISNLRIRSFPSFNTLWSQDPHPTSTLRSHVGA